MPALEVGTYEPPGACQEWWQLERARRGRRGLALLKRTGVPDLLFRCALAAVRFLVLVICHRPERASGSPRPRELAPALRGGTGGVHPLGPSGARRRGWLCSARWCC